jgi:hypothetical protein
MQFKRGRRREEYFNDLVAEAERTWGPQRLEALAAALDTAATALWRLAEAPLEPLDGEPDFIGGGPLRIPAEASHD